MKATKKLLAEDYFITVQVANTFPPKVWPNGQELFFDYSSVIGWCPDRGKQKPFS